MRVLVLGGSGMLGHKLWQRLAPHFDTYGTFRDDFSAYAETGIFDPTGARCHVSVDEIGSVAGVIRELQPDSSCSHYSSL